MSWRQKKITAWFVFSGLCLRFAKVYRIAFRQWLVAVCESVQTVSAYKETRLEE